jgi:hypothetical protein
MKVGVQLSEHVPEYSCVQRMSTCALTSEYMYVSTAAYTRNYRYKSTAAHRASSSITSHTNEYMYRYSCTHE